MGQRSTFAGVAAVMRALTPADADEHPLAQLVGGVGEDDGGVEVATLAEHPEEVGGVEVVEGGGDQTAPDLHKQTAIREAHVHEREPGSEPAERLTTLLSCTSGFMVSCTMNQVAFLRMKAVMRFQWMMFLRQRMLLSEQTQTG